MATDWTLIRKLTNAAIDACEALDELGMSQEEQMAPLRIDGEATGPRIWDSLHGAHFAPENARYAIIRARAQLGEPAPFVDPLSRILQRVGEMAAELVGVEQLEVPVEGADLHWQHGEQSVEGMVEALVRWYEQHLVPGISDAVADHRANN